MLHWDPYPYQFFSGCADVAAVKKKLRELAKVAHPDKPGGDAALMQRINTEYGFIVERAKKGDQAFPIGANGRFTYVPGQTQHSGSTRDSGSTWEPGGKTHVKPDYRGHGWYRNKNGNMRWGPIPEGTEEEVNHTGKPFDDEPIDPPGAKQKSSIFDDFFGFRKKKPEPEPTYRGNKKHEAIDAQLEGLLEAITHIDIVPEFHEMTEHRKSYVVEARVYYARRLIRICRFFHLGVEEACVFYIAHLRRAGHLVLRKDIEWWAQHIPNSNGVYYKANWINQTCENFDIPIS